MSTETSFFETCKCQKRPIYNQRNLYIYAPIAICKLLPTCIRDFYMSKETYICQKRHVFSKEAYIYQKRPTHMCKYRDLQTANDLHRRQIMSGETCICQKRHIFSKEACIYQKRPTHICTDRNLQTANALHKRHVYV